MGPGRRAPTEGVRAGVEVADEVEGGGVGLFTRVPVRVRKAVRMAVEARRSGVRGTSSAGGDMRRAVAECVSRNRYVRKSTGLHRQWQRQREQAGQVAVARAHRVCHGCAGLLLGRHERGRC